jgi:uncharacterized protein YjbI with pentapeptide repeats
MSKHKKLQIPLPNDEAVLSNKDRDKFEDEMLRRKVGELRERNHVGIWTTAVASIILAIGAISTLGLQIYQQKAQAKQYRAEINELKKNRTTANITTLILALGAKESQKRLSAISALSIYLKMKSYYEYREDIIGVMGLVVNTEINPVVKSTLISITTKLRGEGKSVEIAVEDNIQKNISIASKDELREIIMAQSHNGNIGLPLSGVDLSNSDLTSANLLLANLENANLQGAKLTGVDFKGASFQNANFTDTDLSGAKLTDVNFDGASIQGANLTDTDLSGAKLTGINFKGVSFQNANLMDTDLSGAKLTGVDFKGVSFQNANLMDTDLSGAKLTGVDFKGASFQGANFTDTDLSGAKLTGIDFKGVSFQNANLMDTDLSGAKLTGVDFKGARFQGANLTDTDLSGAKLEKAVNLTIEQISKAKTLYKVTLDPLLMEQVKEKYPHLLEELVTQKPTYRTIRYNSSYGPEGVTSIKIGAEYIIYDEIGCGGKGRDILKCIIHKDGTIQAYNKDCDSYRPILGPRIYNGCSKASYGGYFIECCTED